MTATPQNCPLWCDPHRCTAYAKPWPGGQLRHSSRTQMIKGPGGSVCMSVTQIPGHEILLSVSANGWAQTPVAELTASSTRELRDRLDEVITEIMRPLEPG